MPEFDPYYEWLGIPPKDQPAHHYRLLGVELFEEHRSAIDAAANRLMAYLQELSNGEDATLAQELLNEVAAARLCLLNAKQKASYDRQLKALLQKQSRQTANSALPVATPLPDNAVPTPPPVATAQIIADPDAAPQISTKEGQTGSPAERAATSRRASRRTKNKETKVLFAMIGLLLVAAGTLVFFYANKPATKTPTPSRRSKPSSKSDQEKVTSLALDLAKGLAAKATKPKADIIETCDIADLLVSPYRQQLAARDLTEQEKFCQFVAEQAIQLLEADHKLSDHQLDFRRRGMNITKRPPVGAGQEEFNRYTETVLEEGRQDYRDKYTQEFDKQARERLGLEEK